MNFQETKRLIKSIPTNISILLVGNHGIGKSQLVKTISEELGVPLLDIRLSQCEPGDLKGLPYIVGGKTYFAPPDFFPICDKDREELEKILGIKIPPSPQEGFLFFDELNRATRDVQQAVFEIVLDRKLSGRRIPDGWRVISAVNGDDALYQVIAMDPALISRFCLIKFNPTVEEWIEYAQEKNLYPSIIAFIKNHPELLDPTRELIEQSVVDMEKIPDRRSWEMLSNTLSNIKENINQGDLLNIAISFVGNSAAIRFCEFVIENYNVLTAEDILNNFSKKMIKDRSITELGVLNEKIVSFIKKNKELTSSQIKNLIKYINSVPDSVVGEFWSTALNECKEVISKIYNSNVNFKERIVNSFKK